MTKSEQHRALLAKMESHCSELPLCQIPQDIVIGQGNLESEIMFIGEAPGANEAIARTPFVGRGGKLLNKTLKEFAQIEREDIYVTNVVKVRPPENRDPTAQEIAAYVPYLQEEIAFIQPKLMVTLGRFSLNFFLPEAKISAVHGDLQRFEWNGRIMYLLPQYHPAAAMRGTRVLKAFQADIGKIPATLQLVEKQQKNDMQLKGAL